MKPSKWIPAFPTNYFFLRAVILRFAGLRLLTRFLEVAFFLLLTLCLAVDLRFPALRFLLARFFTVFTFNSNDGIKSSKKIFN